MSKKKTHRTQTATDQTARALALLEAGQSAEAVVLFSAALRKDAANYDSQLGLGRAFFDLGEDDKSDAALAKAAELEPGKAAPHLWRARILKAQLEASPTANFHNGKYFSSLEDDDYRLEGEITEHLDAAVSAEPDNLEARCERGLWSAFTDQHDASVCDLHKVYKATPDDPDLLRKIAPALLIAGDCQLGLQLADQLEALGPLDAPLLRARLDALGWGRDDACTEADLRALVALEPTNLLDRRDLAIFLRRHKRHEEEVAERQHIVTLPKAESSDFTALASALAALDRYGDAEAALDVAIRLDPKNGCLFQRRGNMRRLQGRGDEAMADYDQALVFRPNCYSALNNRGILYKQKGDVEAMRGDWLDATQKSQKATLAHQNLADHFLGEAVWAECLMHAEAVVEKQPQNAKALSLRGRARFETGLAEDGLADLERAVELAPDIAAIRNQLGIVLGKMGHPDLQIEECRAALEHAPGDRGILHNLAVCLIKTERPEEALPIFEDIALRRGSASDWGWLGECKRQLDRPAEAIADLEHALTLEAGNKSIQEALDKARVDLKSRQAQDS